MEPTYHPCPHCPATGNFEWYTDTDGTPTLRIQVRQSEHGIRLVWPEDPAVTAVLVRHGLARW